MDIQQIQSKIYTIRGQRVMLDFDLANFYGLKTKVLKQSVRRNFARFPEDFMFELNGEEFANLRSQNVTSSWGGLRYSPFAFTEHGVAMLSSILNSDRAVEINIAIIRTFIAMRHFALTFSELAQKINELESTVGKELSDINEVLRWLGEENQARADEIQTLQAMNIAHESWSQRKRIGFTKTEEKSD